MPLSELASVAPPEIVEKGCGAQGPFSSTDSKLNSFQLMIESVLDYAVFLLDPNGNIRSWNPGARRIKGYLALEVIGKHFSIFYPPEAIAANVPARELSLAVRDGRFEDEGWRLRRDGSRIWANVVITALRAPDGCLVGFGKVTRDLTERRAAAEALRESNRINAEVLDGLIIVSTQLNAALNYTSDCVLTLAQDWTILYGNRHTVELLPDFAVGRSYWDYFPDVLGTPLEQTMREAMKNRTETGYEVFYAGDGQWYKGRIFPTEKGISIFFSNNTEEKLLQEKLALEQLFREKRIEALSHMAGGMAHEISNPLAIIHARASDLKLIAGVNVTLFAKEVGEACDSILRTSDRASTILRGLRGFGREAAGDPLEWASLYDIVQQCTDLQRSRFERHAVSLEVFLEDDLPLLLCREVQVGQILTNLLNNAFDAIHQANSTERWVRLTAAMVDGAFCVHVIDSGPGIEEKFREHLMDAFFTTKTSSLGMGIGLSLSRAIAQDHGGTLALCNGTAHTCFELILPGQ